MALQGGKLVGGNPENKRVDNDFYSTNPIALDMLLSKCKEDGCGLADEDNCYDMLECGCGDGNLCKVMKCWFPNSNLDALDIVDRGYENTIVTDYLTWQPSRKYQKIIANPPFSLAEQFIRKSLDLLDTNGYCAMFLKINFLEGQKREDLYNNYPPKYVYVFRKRMATWNNGQMIDPRTGKNWQTTMCHAWFVWEKGFTGEPIIRWL